MLSWKDVPLTGPISLITLNFPPPIILLVAALSCW